MIKMKVTNDLPNFQCSRDESKRERERWERESGKWIEQTLSTILNKLVEVGD